MRHRNRGSPGNCKLPRVHHTLVWYYLETSLKPFWLTWQPAARGAAQPRLVMPAKKSAKKNASILLVDDDVVIRLTIGEHLRACGFTVIEAASTAEAKVVLQAGPPVDVVIADAQLAGPESGFALAAWVRRHRPKIEMMLVSAIANKAQAASEFCARDPDKKPPTDANGLAARINAITAERKRRARPPSSSAVVSSPRRRRT
ncbi:MAG: response regulator [Hyphomonadaceae bacterium]